MFNNIISSFLLCLLPILSYPQVNLTLEIAKSVAMSNSDVIKYNNLENEILNIDHKQTKWNILPQINLSISNNYNNGLTFDNISGQLISGSKWFNYTNSSISSNWTLFNGLQNIYQIKLSKLNLDLNLLEKDILKRELELEVTTLFLTCLSNEEMYKSSLNQLNYTKEIYTQDSLRVNLGEIAPIILKQSKLNVYSSQIEVSNQKNILDNSINELKNLLKYPINTEIILTIDSSDFLYHNIIKNQYEELISSNSLDIEKSDQQIKIAKVNIRSLKNGWMPTINFNTGYGTNFSSEAKDIISNNTIPFLTQFNQNRSLYFGINISFPIFQNLRIKNNLQKSNILLKKLEIEKNVTKLKSEYLQQNILSEINKAKILWNQSFDVFKESEFIYKTYYEAHKSGGIDINILSNIYKAYKQAQFDTLRFKYEFILKNEIYKIYFKN